ncbi:MAG: double-stranded DNA-binding protein [Thaumarchaeota archaeon]|nr:double-stranded DNA-binding protein [Nitrososphaerota archaeon]
MESDKDLDMLTAKKMIELRKKIAKVAEPRTKTARDVVVSRLVDRGVEVLEAGERIYPKEMKVIVQRLAELVEKGIISDYISGGELLSLLRTLGLRVSVPTRIAIEEHGKLVSLADKIRER